ncbi:MAG: TDT family transporter [Clostridium sp.]
MMKYIKKLENYPIGISGTCLAFITLSNSFKIRGIEFVKPLAVALAIGMLVLMVGKFIVNPRKFYNEMKDPLLGTYYPTLAMVLWLVVAFMYPFAPKICTVLWLAGVVWHYFIVILYTYLRIKERDFKNVLPTAFIVYTGMITGSIASKGIVGVEPIAKFMLLFGFIFYTALLPVILYIVFRSEKIADHQIPSIGIICSPAPLGVVGMLTLYKHPNPIMLWWLIITGLLLLPVVYGYIIQEFKKGFKPTHATFTFPLAIGTLASYKLGFYYVGLGYAHLGHFFTFLGNVEIFITSYVVFKVLFNFLKMFVKALSPEVEAKLEKEMETAGEVFAEEAQ